MSKTKLKPIERPATKRKASRSLGRTRLTTKASTEKNSTSAKGILTLDPAQIWKQEVEELSARRFKSVEQAITAICNRVTKRLRGDAEMSGFLRLILETDPGIQAELRKVLRIDS